MRLFAAMLFLCAGLINSAQGAALSIAATNRTDWSPDFNVGVQGGIPAATNRTTVFNALSYGLPTNGTSDASAAIKAAIAAATSNSVVYIPSGTYVIGTNFQFQSGGVTLRGGLTSNGFPATKIIATNNMEDMLFIGHQPEGGFATNKTSDVTSLAARGSTSLTVSPTAYVLTNFPALAVGDMLEISIGTFELGSASFPIFSSVGFDRLITQTILVTNISGGTIGFRPQLHFDFTNRAKVVFFAHSVGGIGVENIIFTTTNNGVQASVQFEVQMQCLRDSWVKNCEIIKPNSRHQTAVGLVNCSVFGNSYHDSIQYLSPSVTTLVMDHCSGLAVLNNRFYNLGFAVEYDQSFMGNSISYNYFTNIGGTAIDCHNTHPMMNLLEGNDISSGGIEADGYFGSSGPDTIYGNRHPNTVSIKRWSLANIAGNILGTSGADSIYPQMTFANSSNSGVQLTNYAPPYPIIQQGRPNIGNINYSFVSPTNGWNWAGDYASCEYRLPPAYTTPAFTNVLNGFYVFTNAQGPTNVLTGNFSNFFDVNGVTANWAIMFQNPADRTRWYTGRNADDTGKLLWVNSGSNLLTLTTNVTVSNGWAIYIVGGTLFQVADQNFTNYTATIQANYMFQTASNALVNGADLPKSLQYTNGDPSWYGTNTFPPANVTNAHWSEIPAKAAFDAYDWNYFTNPPVAAFVGGPTSGARPLTVTFTNLSGTDNVFWTFGNGTTSTNQTPTVTYLNATNYTVSIVVTNAFGTTTNIATNYITVTNSSQPASGTWVYALPAASVTTNMGHFAGSAVWEKFTNTGPTGTATTIAVLITNYFQVTTNRVCLYDANSNLLSYGSGAINQNGWNEIGINDVQITNGVEGIIYVTMLDSSSFGAMGIQSGTASASSHIDFNSVYGDWPSSTIGGTDNAVNWRIALGINITPDTTNTPSVSLRVNGRIFFQ